MIPSFPSPAETSHFGLTMVVGHRATNILRYLTNIHEGDG